MIIDTYFFPIQLLFGVLVSLCVPSLLTSLINLNRNDNNKDSVANRGGVMQEKNSSFSHTRKKSSTEVSMLEKDLGKTLICKNLKTKPLKNLDTKFNSILKQKEIKENSENNYMSTDIEEIIGIREAISFMQKKSKNDIIMEFKELGNLQKQMKNDLTELKQSLSLYINQNQYNMLNRRSQTNNSLKTLVPQK